MNDFNPEEMKEFIQDFLVESKELIEKVDQELVVLEKNPRDLELLNGIFRAVHTIKGTSSFIGLDKISKFSHSVENILNELRSDKLKVNSEIMDIILESVDIIKSLMDDLEQGKDSKIDIATTTKKIQDILSGKSEPSTEEKKIGEILVEKGLVSEEDVQKALDSQEDMPKVGELLVRDKKITQKQLDQALKIQKKPTISVEKTMRIEVKRLDDLMNNVSELVLRRNRLIQLSKYFEQNYENDKFTSDLTELSNSFDLLTSDLHASLMKVRMVPINKLFSKFPRMVRDLARGSKKEVDLDISGADTELDKAVAEELNDPLLHLIRNAIDHGIEDPAQRKKNKKRPKGTISLNAFHQGNDIVIQIKDDGRGIDTEKVKKKAVAKKIITKDEAESLTEQEAFKLIFSPGFSTAKKITDISGRGVGMDVVKTNIEKLKGVIDIDSSAHAGTAVSLKIPLTLEIMQALIVEVFGETFAIPLTSIIKIESIEEKNIETIRGKEVVNMNDFVLPVTRLDRVFDISSNGSQDKFFAILLGSAEEKIGVMVTDIVGKEEIVIKTLDAFMHDSKYICGATIMGDGHVSLVLDVAELMKSIIN